MFVRPRLKSDVDGATTICSTHESLEQEAEYWEDMCYKAYMQARRARELNAKTAEKLLTVLVTDQANQETVEQSTRST